MEKRTALILEGGGFRAMFSAGIIEVFLEKQLAFESVYGVSAGAAYGVSYISKQIGRNIKVNEMIGDKRYCSWSNLFKQGTMFSWDFIYEEIPQQIIPFNYNVLKSSSSKFYVGTSNCETGNPEFFLLNNADKKDFRTILSASGSLPFIAPMVHYNNMILMDGGLSNSVPFEYALNNGSERAVVILTQPKEYSKGPMKYTPFFKWYYRKFPKVYEMLVTRADRYNASIAKLEQLEKEGIAYVIRPPKVLEIDRIENNPQKTAAIYHAAMEQANVEFSALQEWLSEK